MCAYAVKNDGLSLGYVREQSLYLCALALEQNIDALKYVSKDLALYAFAYVKSQCK